MKKTIICFGDSNTYGYSPLTGGRYDSSTRWAGKLAEITGYNIIEEGMNGRTSVFPDPLLPWGTGASYIEACVCSHSPIDLLIIMLGTNDMKTYVCNCPDASAKGVVNLARMARNACGNPDLKVLLIAPPHIRDHASEIEAIMLQLNLDSIRNSQRLASYLSEQAALNNCYFLDAEEYVQTSDEDAVHMTPEGHARLAEAIADKLKEIFSLS